MKLTLLPTIQVRCPRMDPPLQTLPAQAAIPGGHRQRLPQVAGVNDPPELRVAGDSQLSLSLSQKRFQLRIALEFVNGRGPP